jgi:ABC-type multidrug transport system ATPase subunit
VIELRGVGKTYTSLFRPPIRALEDVTLTIARGEVVGLAGPNGAGKSTLINLLLGYLRPTEGRITIDGLPPRTYAERHGIAYVSELVAVPPKWGVDEALTRYALLAGVAGDRLAERRDDVVRRLGLEEHRGKRVRQLSKGTLQRFGIAQALLARHDVVVLDEPTHGLDPLWTQRFRDLVREIRDPDRAVLVASHNLDELERVADRVAIVDRGRVQRLVTMRARPAAAGDGAAGLWRITVVTGVEHVAAVFEGAVAVGADTYEVRASGLGALNAGLAALLARGALLSAVVPAYSVLERQFREAVGEGSA